LNNAPDVCDYRYVNAFTVEDAFPMPNADEAIEKIGRLNLITTCVTGIRINNFTICVCIGDADILLLLRMFYAFLFFLCSSCSSFPPIYARFSSLVMSAIIKTLMQCAEWSLNPRNCSSWKLRQNTAARQSAHCCCV